MNFCQKELHNFRKSDCRQQKCTQNFFRSSTHFSFVEVRLIICHSAVWLLWLFISIAPCFFHSFHFSFSSAFLGYISSSSSVTSVCFFLKIFSVIYSLQMHNLANICQLKLKSHLSTFRLREPSTTTPNDWHGSNILDRFTTQWHQQCYVVSLH